MRDSPYARPRRLATPSRAQTIKDETTNGGPVRRSPRTRKAPAAPSSHSTQPASPYATRFSRSDTVGRSLAGTSNPAQHVREKSPSDESGVLSSPPQSPSGTRTPSHDNTGNKGKTSRNSLIMYKQTSGPRSDAKKLFYIAATSVLTSPNAYGMKDYNLDVVLKPLWDLLPDYKREKYELHAQYGTTPPTHAPLEVVEPKLLAQVALGIARELLRPRIDGVRNSNPDWWGAKWYLKLRARAWRFVREHRGAPQLPLPPKFTAVEVSRLDTKNVEWLEGYEEEMLAGGDL